MPKKMIGKCQICGFEGRIYRRFNDHAKVVEYAIKGIVNKNKFLEVCAGCLKNIIKESDKKKNQKELYNVIPETKGSGIFIIYVYPKAGKTNVVLHIARNAAMIKNVPVAIFSLDMSKEKFSMYLHFYEARIDPSCLSGRLLRKNEWMELVSAVGDLCYAPIYIDDSTDILIREVITKVHRLKKEKDVGMIIIDHLELIKRNSSSKRIDLDFIKIMKSLKTVAEELDIVVVAFLDNLKTLDVIKHHGDMVAIISCE